ncbi:MAG: azurin [Bacteroidetes bacterium]|nr:azurin [Cryomorphaceae bacterium]MBL6677553.1 azurin [Flavobacteriaceae bacterium]MDA0330476.1 azurin [Bacteroidota bacterium]MDA0885213.1 azurin [Bacteroidota bacterium]MDA1225324.1 azurin [Bacteroidota bacterium]
MKKLLSILTILLILSCNNSNTSKENFQYERVKEDNVSAQNNSVSNNIILNSNDQMKFDKRIIRVKANEIVTLTLNHNGKFPAISMGHNFVLIKKDVDIDDYALRAVSARDNDYIPEGGDEIAYTKMLGGGESDTITFDAPEPGTYTFICSFPGHYQLMMGEFIVL